MALRVGVDLDGTLADLSAAYHALEYSMFGEETSSAASDETDAPADVDRDDADERALKAARDASARRDAIWRDIRRTTDFWTTLAPIEPGAIARLHQTARTRGWDVFFITQRPPTSGDTVQRQTQRWLIAQGFEMPSVLTLAHGRGRAAAALELDVLIDDLPKNCVDVIADSHCRPLLMQRLPDPVALAAARQMNITVVNSLTEAIGLLVQPRAEARPSAVARVLGALGLAR